MALLMRGTDLRGALAHLDRALESNPNLIDAVQLRALVRARLGERAALDDVDRLVESATPHRLYNAACAVAILSETAGTRGCSRTRSTCSPGRSGWLSRQPRPPPTPT